MIITDERTGVCHPSDDGQNIISATATAGLVENVPGTHEPDVAAGYFAVCREYVPGGINGKQPRTAPAGEAMGTESPSVYQIIYRSMFDRKPGKGSGEAVNRARNVFYIVVKHGRLVLYDDSEQLAVRHIISLAHHNISIYGGEDTIPEAELWVKRNAICLSRKSTVDVASKPFYLFSENCSEKEDFYFALLQNQEVKPNAHDNPPRPQQYDVNHIITLLQELHSSKERQDTRWINALFGRAFLALYKTREMEELLAKTITKKISRVQRPDFLSEIVVQNIDLGESAPHITNPRLKDLTIDGDCCAEADLKYSGNFRLELAVTIRTNMGARYYVKARGYRAVLAVVIKKVEGHGLIRFKPPPCNRIWVSFETMPDIEMVLEPSSYLTQITVGLALRAIESRIREVIAETVVLPHWDDIPFTDTQHQEFRGGIWARPSRSSEQNPIPDETLEDESEAVMTPPASPRSKDDRTMSMPTRLIAKPVSRKGSSANGASSGVQKRVEPPTAMRSRSFASVANPLVTLDNANVDSARLDSKGKQRQRATSAMIAISSRSIPLIATGSPQDPTTFWGNLRAGSSSSGSSKLDSIPEQSVAQATPITSSAPAIPSHGSLKPTPQEERNHSGSHEERQSLIAVGAVTAAAERHRPQTIEEMASGRRSPPLDYPEIRSPLFDEMKKLELRHDNDSPVPGMRLIPHVRFPGGERLYLPERLMNGYDARFPGGRIPEGLTDGTDARGS